MSSPNTLAELIHAAPGNQTAVILPETGIRLTYHQLRDQVMTMADALAAARHRTGRPRRHRCCPTACPPSSVFWRPPSPAPPRRSIPDTARTSSAFILEDTAAKILLCPPDGAEDARARPPKAKCRSIRSKWTPADLSASSMRPNGRTVRAAFARRYRAGPAHQRQHRTAQARAHPPSQSGRLGAQHRAALRALADDVSLCAMPLFHVHGLVASTISTLLSGGTVVVPVEIQSALLLAHGARLPRHLVFRRAHHSPPSARARGRRAAAGRRKSALHPLLQRRAAAGDDGAHGAGLRRPRCSRPTA